VDWLHEVLGVRKRSGHTELRDIVVSELSAVDHPASGFPDWLLMKAAESDPDARLLRLIRAGDPDDDEFEYYDEEDVAKAVDLSHLSVGQLEEMRARIEEEIRSRQDEQSQGSRSARRSDPPSRISPAAGRSAST
jgi:hypothetical protein